jgi:hypothetical protein
MTSCHLIHVVFSICSSTADRNPHQIGNARERYVYLRVSIEYTLSLKMSVKVDRLLPHTLPVPLLLDTKGERVRRITLEIHILSGELG